MKKPKNEFREQLKKEQQTPQDKTAEALAIETKKVGEAEMMRRNKVALALQYRCRRKGMAIDDAYAQDSIALLEQLEKDVGELPLCEAKIGILGSLEKQIATLKEQTKVKIFTSREEAVLSSLENDIAYAGAEKPKSQVVTVEDEEDDDDDDDPNEVI